MGWPTLRTERLVLRPLSLDDPDEARVQQGMTKAELARRAGMAPEAVRRLFTAEGPNPTAATLIAR